MVAVLFKFQYVSRSHDWMLHLSAVQNMIPIIISMDGIKCRRLFPVYLSEIRNLEHNDPDIWKYSSVQTTKVSHTAIRVDYTGEQQNDKLKIQGGLIG